MDTDQAQQAPEPSLRLQKQPYIAPQLVELIVGETGAQATPYDAPDLADLLMVGTDNGALSK